jgi:hypothetical protein
LEAGPQGEGGSFDASPQVGRDYHRLSSSSSRTYRVFVVVCWWLPPHAPPVTRRLSFAPDFCAPPQQLQQLYAHIHTPLRPQPCAEIYSDRRQQLQARRLLGHRYSTLLEHASSTPTAPPLLRRASTQSAVACLTRLPAKARASQGREKGTTNHEGGVDIGSALRLEELVQLLCLLSSQPSSASSSATSLPLAARSVGA